jgi:hypothetical protein
LFCLCGILCKLIDILFVCTLGPLVNMSLDQEVIVHAPEEIKTGAADAWKGWLANSPSGPGMANCVAIAACAGANVWFSFLLSVKRIAKGDEILSNALPFNEEWEEEEEEET